MLDATMPGIVCFASLGGLALLLRWAGNGDKDLANRMGLPLILPVLWMMAILSLMTSVGGLFANI